MSVYRLGADEPDIHSGAFIHPDAVVIGAVTIGEGASVWPGAVLRADFGRIMIGDRTSVQDGTVIHATERWPTIIGSDCIVGHNAHIEGAVVEDRCLIGSMSTCLHGVVVEHDALVGACALLAAGTRVPTLSQALGVPAQISPQPDAARFTDYLTTGVAKYVGIATRYRQTMQHM